MSCERSYRALESDRDFYLERARTAARLTIPYLIPISNESNGRENDTFPLPWNGIGARGVHNLASRLLLALLPPTETFFRFTTDEAKMVEAEMQMVAAGASEDQIAKFKSEFEIGLAKLERMVLRSIEASNDRVAVHEMLLHLVVGGNALLYVAKDGLKTFHLNRYVCQRDLMGNPLEAIVCEQLSYENLPGNVKEMLDEADGEVTGGDR